LGLGVHKPQAAGISNLIAAQSSKFVAEAAPPSICRLQVADFTVPVSDQGDIPS
jgi:hypothetical protein